MCLFSCLFSELAWEYVGRALLFYGTFRVCACVCAYTFVCLQGAKGQQQNSSSIFHTDCFPKYHSAADYNAPWFSVCARVIVCAHVCVCVCTCRYNGSLPNGDRGRRKSRFALYKRPKANGVKPSTVHVACSPQAAKVQHTHTHPHTHVHTCTHQQSKLLRLVLCVFKIFGTISQILAHFQQNCFYMPTHNVFEGLCWQQINPPLVPGDWICV